MFSPGVVLVANFLPSFFFLLLLLALSSCFFLLSLLMLLFLSLFVVVVFFFLRRAPHGRLKTEKKRQALCRCVFRSPGALLIFFFLPEDRRRSVFSRSTAFH